MSDKKANSQVLYTHATLIGIGLKGFVRSHRKKECWTTLLKKLSIPTYDNKQ